jgi:protein-tyrosine-phosphatase
MGGKIRTDIVTYDVLYIARLERISDQIPRDRKKVLTTLSALICQELTINNQVNIAAICTHNSRRSQLFQLWLAVAADYLCIKGVNALSAGTEKTAFNYRMVDAIKRKGFDLVTKDGNHKNPNYHLTLSDKVIHFYSKTIDELTADHLIAIMVCDDADQNCPMIPSASHRISMRYIDPNYADDSPEETLTYDQKVDEIGCELLYLMSLVKASLKKEEGK